MAYIKEDFVRRIKDQAQIEEIVGIYAELKKKGRHFFALSPFTQEKTPSFCVDVQKQRYTDYSSNRSGDVIDFLMEKEGLSYPEAIEWLARHYGYSVEYENEEWAKDKERKAKEKETLRPLVKAALRKYQEALAALPADHPARQELARRGYDDTVTADWGIGYAPGGTYLFDELKQINRLDEGRQVWLVGEKYDKLWERVVYPIHDENGLVVGFAGRKLEAGSSKLEDAPKWINPAENALYKKEKTWYGLHRARRAIQSAGEVWIVEGYNDVIAWHRHGLENTVAPCGTAITEKQIRILRRYARKVVLCLDGDDAGQRAGLKLIPMLMAGGLSVDIVELKAQSSKLEAGVSVGVDGAPADAGAMSKIDPDDFVRVYAKEIAEKGLAELVAGEKMRRQGFTVMLKAYVKGNELEKATGARELVDVVAKVEDEHLHEIYLNWIAKESGVKISTLKGWHKDLRDQVRQDKIEASQYLLPQSVKVPLSELKDDIERYGMFQAHDKIYMLTGDEKPYTFRECSNFSIEIIQHMHDEKLPMKLVRIRNTAGQERIFDVPSIEINTPLGFDNAVTNHGNFLWSGGRSEFQRLRSYLFDRMGVGYKIEVLGWQPERFWVWNNAITRPGQPPSPIDENGVYKNGVACYYIPSANKIYENNSFKFTPQKKVVLTEASVSFSGYIQKMMAVHRNHAMTAALFTVASTFLDIVEDKLGNFPLLYLYGPASSGKDQLIECCQSFYGLPQSPIHIGNKVSTAKAQVRKFAQFRNMIVHLSEYRPGDQQLDELLKGFWDRRGYERGTIESAYGTETVPIHSSVIFTGNHYPDDDALITRVIVEEMNKTEFTLEEKKRYQELKDLNKHGFSSLTVEMMNQRERWENKFKETYRKVEAELKKDLGMLSAHDRMIGNLAVMGAAYELMKDVLVFPFSYADWLAHARDGLERQVRKLNTASVVQKWWDCFLAAIRTRTDPIRHGREFELRDDRLYFNITHTYNRVAAQWYAQYHENAPSKSKVMDIVKKQSAFIEEKNSHRMSERKSSVWVMDLTRLNITEDLEDAVQWQRMEQVDMTYMPGITSLPPSIKNTGPEGGRGEVDKRRRGDGGGMSGEQEHENNGPQLPF